MFRKRRTCSGDQNRDDLNGSGSYHVGNLNSKIFRRKFTNTSCQDFVGTDSSYDRTRTIKHVRNFKFDYSAGLFRLCQDPRKL